MFSNQIHNANEAKAATPQTKKQGLLRIALAGVMACTFAAGIVSTMGCNEKGTARDAGKALREGLDHAVEDAKEFSDGLRNK